MYQVSCDFEIQNIKSSETGRAQNKYLLRKNELILLSKKIKAQKQYFNFDLKVHKQHGNLFGQILSEIYPLSHIKAVIYLQNIKIARQFTNILNSIGYLNSLILKGCKFKIEPGGHILVGVTGSPIVIKQSKIRSILHFCVPPSLQFYFEDLSQLHCPDHIISSSIFVSKKGQLPDHCIESYCKEYICRHVQIYLQQYKYTVIPKPHEFHCRQCDVCRNIPWGVDNCDDIVKRVYV